MARPKKSVQEANDHVLPPIRCTASEKERIRMRAQKLGLTVSEFVRTMALNGKIIVQQSTHDYELVEQLKRIGVNINQQTRRLNTTGEIPDQLYGLWERLDLILSKFL